MQQEEPKTQYKKDDEQQELIRIYQLPNPPNVILTLASPGTGKTTTISRIIESFVQSNRNINFLGLTFTKRTKWDLISKLMNMNTSEEKKQILFNRVKNFHSFANNLIKWKRIIQDEENKQIIKQITDELDIQNDDLKKRVAKRSQKLIENFIKRGLEQNQWEKQVESLRGNNDTLQEAKVVLKYRSVLQKRWQDLKQITYDYSLLKALEKIKQGRSCFKINLDKIDLLIIDQFQDSNPAQIKMIQALLDRARKNNIKLLMVGDFDQNIYTWRGANLNTIKDFLLLNPYFPMYLKQSYRMNKATHQLSQALITSVQKYNDLRHQFYKDYQFEPKNQKNNQPQIIQFEDEASQVNFIVSQLYKHIKNGIQYGQITILIRSFKSSYFFKKFKHELIRRVGKGQKQIPYDVQIHKEALKSKTVKYMLAIFDYFLKRDARKSRKKTMKRLLGQFKVIGKSDKVYIKMLKHEQIDRKHFIYEQQQSNHEKRINTWQKILDNFQIIETIIYRYKNFGEDPDFQTVCKQIFTILKDAEWSKITFDSSKLEQFLEIIREQASQLLDQQKKQDPIFCYVRKLIRENYEIDDQEQYNRKEKKRQLKLKKKPNRVQFQTIHNSKGLQYKVVFLCSLNFAHEPDSFQKKEKGKNDAQKKEFENRWIISQVQSDNEQLRIIYTAITRNSQFAYVTSSKKGIKKPNQFIDFSQSKQIAEHPQFLTLKKKSGNFKFVRYDQLKDGQVKAYFKQVLAKEKLERQKKKKNQKKERKRCQRRPNQNESKSMKIQQNENIQEQNQQKKEEKYKMKEKNEKIMQQKPQKITKQNNENVQLMDKKERNQKQTNKNTEKKTQIKKKQFQPTLWNYYKKKQ